MTGLRATLLRPSCRPICRAVLEATTGTPGTGPGVALKQEGAPGRNAGRGDWQDGPPWAGRRYDPGL